MFRRRRGRASDSARWRVAAVTVLLLVVGSTARADDDVADPPETTGSTEPIGPPEVFPDLEPGGELLLFEEISMVTAAARRPMRTDWSSAALSVVTADDIHFSGLENLSEVLQFQPGIDYMPAGAASSAVGVRGLHEAYTDRLLLLVDGRNANDPALGAPNFEWLPIFAADVERIEIVRGPAGALWGANAFTGLINIVMKDPEDTPGWLLATRVDHFGDIWTHARWGGREGELAWRVSLGYEDVVSSEDALDSDDFDSNDFARAWKVDTTLVHRVAGGDRLTFGLGYQYREMGAMTSGNQPEQTARVNLLRTYLRFDFEGVAGISGHLQWHLNQTDWDDSDAFNVVAAETDLEGQVDLDIADHEISLGGNFRGTSLDSRNDGAEPEVLILHDAPLVEFRAGIFVADRYYPTDELILEGQLRADWYSETEVDWSGRLSALLAVDERRAHVLRIGVARAIRAPQSILSRVSGKFSLLPSPPLPPETYGLLFLEPDGDIGHERTWSIEAGYTGRPMDGLTVTANAFWQRYDNLLGFERLEDPLDLGRPIFQPAAQKGADSYGVEIEAALRGEGWRLGAWYALNEFETDEPDQPLRAFLAAVHKVGVAGRLTLFDGWTLNLNYRYASETDGSHLSLLDAVPGASAGDEDVDAHHRLDLALTARPRDSLEVTLGVEDLFNREYSEFRTIPISGHETPGRTFFLRLQLEF